MTIATRFFARLRPLLVGDSETRAQGVLISTRRMFYLALASIISNLARGMLFLFALSPHNAAEDSWRNYMLLLSMLLGSGMVIVAVSGWRLRTAEQALPGHWLLQFGAIVLIMSAGVSITVADQLVTPAITPFLIACALVAAVFIQPPLIALLSYLTAFFALWFLLGIVQADSAQLLSNRVNAASVMGVAFCLSTFTWTGFVARLRQRSFIEMQQAELERKNRQLAQLAGSDPLTGLLNRRSLHGLIEIELDRMQQKGYASSLIVIDLDYFKQVNDRYGHPAGDRALQGVAQALREALDDRALLARWGGEEFLAVLPECELDEAMEIAETLRSRIAALTFTAAAAEFTVTASFGVAALDPGTAKSFACAYRRADQALYASKQLGRNRIAAAAPEQRQA